MFCRRPESIQKPVNGVDKRDIARIKQRCNYSKSPRRETLINRKSSLMGKACFMTFLY